MLQSSSSTLLGALIRLCIYIVSWSIHLSISKQLERTGFGYIIEAFYSFGLCASHFELNLWSYFGLPAFQPVPLFFLCLFTFYKTWSDTLRTLPLSTFSAFCASIAFFFPHLSHVASNTRFSFPNPPILISKDWSLDLCYPGYDYVWCKRCLFTTIYLCHPSQIQFASLYLRSVLSRAIPLFFYRIFCFYLGLKISHSYLCVHQISSIANHTVNCKILYFFFSIFFQN